MQPFGSPLVFEALLHCGSAGFVDGSARNPRVQLPANDALLQQSCARPARPFKGAAPRQQLPGGQHGPGINVCLGR